MKDKGHIYLIRNLLNGKGYVGQTRSTVEKRFRFHLWHAKADHKSALYSAIRAYGVEAFAVTRLLTCEESLLNEMEIYFIRVCNTFAPEGYGYNMTKGGEGGPKKRKPLSAEHRKKISESNKGMKRPPRSEQWLKRQRAAKIGKSQSVESNLKRSKSLKGKPKPPRTAEHNARIAASKKGQNVGKPWSEARRAAQNRKAQ